MTTFIRERLVWATPAAAFSALTRLAASRYHGHPLLDRPIWAMRSMLAPMIIRGGATGDRSRPAAKVGESIDHWRVAAADPGRAYALACELRGLGEARIAWEIEPRPANRCLIRQKASLAAAHALGGLYWTLSSPPHAMVFARLLNGIAIEAERDGSRPPSQRPRSGLRLVRRAITVPRQIEETFEFFADARNLEAITPPWLNFEITTPTPITMQEGATIDYRIRLHGIPVRWHTRIDAWEPCTRFVDRQVRGPYRWWHHEHRFERVDGGTRVIDEVEYASPLRWISEPLIVRRDVERIFDYRSERLVDLLAAGGRIATPI